MPSGELGDEIGRQGGRVGERLVESRGKLRQQLGGIGAEQELVVVGPVPLRDLARVGQLVERALLEADREGLHPLGRLERCQGGQRARVDTAREEHAHRNVGDQVRSHRVPQSGAELLRQLGLVARAGLCGWNRDGAGEALQAGLALPLPDE